MEVKQEGLEIDELRSSENETESKEQLSKNDENVLEVLDSVNNYLTLMDSLSSKFRQGWFELASARHSMGSSRISSALFDHKHHHAATLFEVDRCDADSANKQPHFTLHKWASSGEQEFSSEEGKVEEDELHQKSSSAHEHQEKHLEKNGAETFSSPNSPRTPESHVQKERAKSLSMFGTLVSPKLRAAQLSFETVLEAIQEVANVRSSMLSAYEKVLREMGNIKT